MLQTHANSNDKIQTEPSILLLSEIEKKHNKTITHVFRQLHEILHGKIFITYQQYAVMLKCISHYKTQLGQFQKNINEKLQKSLKPGSKERHNLTMSEVNSAITALEKLRVDLTQAKENLEFLQSKLIPNTLHQSATKLIGSGQALQLTIKSLQEYVTLAESILSDPVFTDKLLQAMALLQLQTVGTSGLCQHIKPLLEKMSERKAPQFDEIKRLNLAAIKLQLGIPPGTSEDPIAFINNPIGKSTCFFTNIKLCLENCTESLKKITEQNSDIQGLQLQIDTLLATAGSLSKKVNMVAPSTTEDYVRKLLEQDHKIDEMKHEIAELKQKNENREKNIMYTLLEQDAARRLEIPPIPEKNKAKTLGLENTTANIGSSMIKNIQEFSNNHPYITRAATGVAIIAGFFLVKKIPSFTVVQSGFWKIGKHAVSGTLQSLPSASSVVLRR